MVNKIICKLFFIHRDTFLADVFIFHENAWIGNSIVEYFFNFNIHISGNLHFHPPVALSICFRLAALSLI